MPRAVTSVRDRHAAGQLAIRVEVYIFSRRLTEIAGVDPSNNDTSCTERPTSILECFCFVQDEGTLGAGVKVRVLSEDEKLSAFEYHPTSS